MSETAVGGFRAVDRRLYRLIGYGDYLKHLHLYLAHAQACV